MQETSIPIDQASASPDDASVKSKPLTAEIPGEQGGLSLRANFSWTFMGNVVYAACQWGLLVVLARFTSPEHVGQFSLGLAITAPIVTFSNLGLRNVQASDTLRKHDFGHYLGLNLGLTVVAAVVIAAIAVAGGYARETAVVIAAVGLAKCIESVSDVFYGLLQQHERMDRIALSLIIKGVASLPALGCVVYFTHSVLWGTLTLAVVWAALLLTYDVRSGVLVLRTAYPDRRTQARSTQASVLPLWQSSSMAQLAWIALPLGLTGTLGSLSPAIPRYVIAHYMGERDLGFYSAMAYLLIAANTVVRALGQSGLPRLARSYAAGDLLGFRRLLAKQVGVVVGLSVLLVAIAALAGAPLLTLIYGPTYATHANVLYWIAVANVVVCLGVMLNYALTSIRRFRVQLLQAAIATAASAIASFVLIPRFGMVGAAIVPACAAGVQVVFASSVLIRALKAAGNSHEGRFPMETLEVDAGEVDS